MEENDFYTFEPDYNELNKLVDYLETNNYFYTVDRLLRGKIVKIYSTEEKKQDDFLWDAVIHAGSYGSAKGLLEIFGTIVKSSKDLTEGFLTANDIIKRLEKAK